MWVNDKKKYGNWGIFFFYFFILWDFVSIKIRHVYLLINKSISYDIHIVQLVNKISPMELSCYENVTLLENIWHLGWSILTITSSVINKSINYDIHIAQSVKKIPPMELSCYFCCLLLFKKGDVSCSLKSELKRISIRIRTIIDKNAHSRNSW